MTNTFVLVNGSLPEDQGSRRDRGQGTAGSPRSRPGVCATVLGAPLAEPAAEELARRFAALADPVRLRLLSP